MFQNKAVEILRRCESELRHLLAAAAGAGDYDSVLKLTSWAKQLAFLAASASGNTIAQKTGITIGTTSSKRSPKRMEYPRFGRRGDSLVKVGWSKSEKKEYEHKALKRAVDVLISTLIRAGANGRIFKADDILPLADTGDDTEIPAYQVYLILAWLRNLGLIDQHGRQGYSIAKPKELSGVVESAWQALSEI